VQYSSVVQYTSLVQSLGLPDDTTAALTPDKYCFPVPTKVKADGQASSATKEHCQDFVPPLSYQGIVPTYNAQGARVFVVPSVFEAAVNGSASARSKGKGTSYGTTSSSKSKASKVVSGGVSVDDDDEDYPVDVADDYGEVRAYDAVSEAEGAPTSSTPNQPQRLRKSQENSSGQPKPTLLH